MRLNLKIVVPALSGVLAAALAGPVASAQPAQAGVPAATTGVLLLAHGGAPEWNGRVLDVARSAATTYPTEVAFGMASRPALEAALARLRDRGATEVVAVPLFVSSHSSVVTSTEYLLGLRSDPPSDLALFAKMHHGSHGGHGAGPMPAREAEVVGADPSHAVDLTSPIAVGVPLRMTEALNRHPLVGDILADRAMAISRDPASEAVLLVAHGPVPDDDNRRWLDDMAVLGQRVRARAPFAAVEAMTLRDDAGPALRTAATAELRALVAKHQAAGRRVLVVPHLLSFGGIEQGLRSRLDGLEYSMALQALLPDPRIAEWVRASVAPGTGR